MLFSKTDFKIYTFQNSEIRCGKTDYFQMHTSEINLKKPTKGNLRGRD